MKQTYKVIEPRESESTGQQVAKEFQDPSLEFLSFVELNWNDSRTLEIMFNSLCKVNRETEAVAAGVLFEKLSVRGNLSAWQFGCVAADIARASYNRGFDEGRGK